MVDISIKKIKRFQDKILVWFKENGRYFPWRKPSATHYELIIAEVLLQRTKAETISKFYPSFIRKYPSWIQLGTATEVDLQDFLKPIGLYKQRGSGLYRLAQEMNKRHGRFPKSRFEVEKLPMMGQYNTNAYELFVLKKPSPLLDVNMKRVLTRFFGLKKTGNTQYKQYLLNLSKRIVNHSKSIQINWAILDFGATICSSKKPKCGTCIFKEECLYFPKYKSPLDC